VIVSVASSTPTFAAHVCNCGRVWGRQLTKRVFEAAPEGEMDEHLGYGKHDPAGRDGGNSRNGKRRPRPATSYRLAEIDSLVTGPHARSRARTRPTSGLATSLSPRFGVPAGGQDGQVQISLAQAVDLQAQVVVDHAVAGFPHRADRSAPSYSTRHPLDMLARGRRSPVIAVSAVAVSTCPPLDDPA
jgi:hypothetical protein